MNCKQAEGLMPLYAGRDLDERRANLVTEHLQLCAACARVAAEYREAFQLTQQFVPPIFEDDVYAGIRRRVLREIEHQPAASTLPPIFANWFTPRMRWALASAVVIVVALFSFYLVAIRQTNDQTMVANREPVRHPQADQLPPDPTATPSPLVKAKPHSGQGTPSRRDRRPAVAAKLNSAEITAKSVIRETPETNFQPNITDATHDENTLRVEMQTKDPNIRIIWFTQIQTKASNSKGT